MIIHYVTDTTDWVQSNRLGIFQKYMPEYQFKLCTFRDFFGLKNYFLRKHANVYFTNWRGLLLNRSALSHLDSERCIVSITSHYNLGGGLNESRSLPPGQSSMEAITNSLPILKMFPHISVNSRILQEYLKPWIETTLSENGVDHRHFVNLANRSKFNPNSISVGWIGKVKAAKNYDECIKPAFEALSRMGFRTFAYPITKENNTVSLMDPGGMVKYYNTLDFYVCASWHEGTPNPALEAASCGVPVISTRVGNMPDFIQAGINGDFIEPNSQSLIEKILSYRALTEANYQALSMNARRTIEDNWTWDIKINNYRDLFHKVYRND